MKTTLLALALAFSCSGASAQADFTSVSLDGHTTFSDRPVAPPDAEPEAAPVKAAPRSPAGTLPRGSRGAQLVNASEAQRRLTQAQLNRKRGMAPLATEQTRTGDRIEVNHRYWKRQEGLRQDVDLAQQRLNATRPAQLAGR